MLLPHVGEKCMILKEMVITNINTTKFVTLEFGDKKLIALKSTNQLNIICFLCFLLLLSFSLLPPSLIPFLFLEDATL